MNIKNTNPIKKLHITEKAGLMAETGAYIFQVEKNATKKAISREISMRYKVNVVKVNVVVAKPTKVTSRGKVGQTAGFKKAYVYLKKGDTIDIA